MNSSTEPDSPSKYAERGFWVLLGLVLLAGALMAAPFLSALVWALTFSVLMSPLYDRLRRKLNGTLSATLTLLATLGLIVIPFAIVGTVLVVQIGAFLRGLEASAPEGSDAGPLAYITDQLQSAVGPLANRLGMELDIGESVSANLESIVAGLSAPLGAIATSTGTGLFSVGIGLITMFYLLRDGHRLREPLLALSPLPPVRSLALAARLRETIVAVFLGVVLVALIQGAMSGLAYWAVGVQGPLLWAALTTVLCVIPLVGAPVVYLPLAFTLAAQGHYGRAAGLVLLGMVAVSSLDNLLRPFFIGARVPLHPLAIFFSLLGGVFLLGPVGIVAGPLLLTLLLGLLEVVVEQRRT